MNLLRFLILAALIAIAGCANLSHVDVGHAPVARTITTLGRAAQAAVPAEVDASGAAIPAPFTTYAHVLRLIDNAATITLSAYTLAPSSAIVQHVVDRAASGAKVSIVLTGDGFRYALNQNCQILKMLVPTSTPCAAGLMVTHGATRVRLTSYPLHMKALVTDGTTVIVTDENFARHGLYEILPGAMRQTAERAILGTAGYIGPFTTSKGMSLSMEAAALAEPRSKTIYVETESFGAGNPVYRALQTVLANGRNVVLVINAKDARTSRGTEPAVLALARGYPNSFRASLIDSTEKISVNGTTCFTGSANASPGLTAQIDYGLRIDNATACNYLLRRLVENARG